MINNRKFSGLWLIIIPDAILLLLSLYLAGLIRYDGNFSRDLYLVHVRAFSLLYAIWLVVFFIHGLFEAASFRRYSSVVFNLVSANLVNLILAVAYFYFQPNLILTPRRFLLVNIACAFVLILVWHLLAKYFLKNRLKTPLYLFSFNNELLELEEEIKRNAFLGFEVLGHLNQESLKEFKPQSECGIILTDNLQGNQEVLRRFYELRKSGVKFYNFQEFYEELARRVYLSQLSELWFLENINYREKVFYNFVKRAVDILAGLVFGLVFIILYPFCALLIKLDSSGKVIITQNRVGKDGKIFKVYKFRSMFVDEKDIWTKLSDSRITRLGNFLRKSRLDELPQSINLLLGNMSLVGPRPEQAGIVERLKNEIPFYEERHLVKPGLTGWAQLNIYAGSMEETKLKLQYDFYYIKHRSFLFDLEIILKTTYYIFTGQGR